MGRFEFTKELLGDDRWEDTAFMVEATSCEQLDLWERWNKVCEWKQDNPGYLYTIGSIDIDGHDYPICVNVSWVVINGVRIIFYHSTSLVVHHEWVGDFVKESCNHPKWDKGIRTAHCDAMNFHHAINHIEDLTGGKIPWCEDY